VRTGYSAIADEWIGITPGTDGLLVGGVIQQLLRTEQIDWPFLARMTNACWLVIDAPGSEDHGMFARDANAKPLVWDSEKQGAYDSASAPAFSGQYTLKDGRTVTPAFHLLAKRFLEAQYSPTHVAQKTGIPAERIVTLAAELAEAAFAKSEDIDHPWIDWRGTEHKTLAKRGVAVHAMRGISAHANGFHTCRMIHILQSLLGTIDAPGGFLYKPPFPKSCPPGPKPARPADKSGKALVGMPLGFPCGPEDLLVTDEGAPQRIDKAFSWDFPLAVHGMLHMVLHNAWAGDPYKIDLLFMYMANMGWNSAMNLADTHKYLTDRDAQGEYKIPKIIYSDAYYSEMVTYADLVLPDTTYLERWDCISLLDRPISSAHGPGDSIRQPVIAPNRDVRPFQDVLLDLGARLRLPGFVDKEGNAAYPGGYSDYITNHERTPGIGPLAGWRGEGGKTHGHGPKNPEQLQRYIENGCFWTHSLPETQRYMRHSNKPYLEYAKNMGWVGSTDPITIQLYSETLQKFRLAAEGFGPAPAPEHARARIAEYFDPLPLWYGASEVNDGFPLHAITQRPMQMYHSWGSQNPWLRQITAQNRLFLGKELAQKQDLRDGDWVWVISRIGRVRAQIAIHNGVNGQTIWTWNAIGKRRGTWGLCHDAPES
ncbi:MAG: molybdopterin dinucleotide binding domain-containing protein, partial [Pseudomonadota bacterium]